MFAPPMELSVKVAKADGADDVSAKVVKIGTHAELCVMFKMLSQSLAKSGELPISDQLSIILERDIPTKREERIQAVLPLKKK